MGEIININFVQQKNSKVVSENLENEWLTKITQLRKNGSPDLTPEILDKMEEILNATKDASGELVKTALDNLKKGMTAFTRSQIIKKVMETNQYDLESQYPTAKTFLRALVIRLIEGR